MDSNVVVASTSSSLNSITMIKMKIRDTRETLNYEKSIKGIAPVATTEILFQ